MKFVSQSGEGCVVNLYSSPRTPRSVLYCHSAVQSFIASLTESLHEDPL